MNGSAGARSGAGIGGALFLFALFWQKAFCITACAEAFRSAGGMYFSKYHCFPAFFLL